MNRSLHSSSSLGILVATWGNPWYWDLAEYVDKEGRPLYRSLATLPSTVKLIKDKGLPLNKIVILVQDTLIKSLDVYSYEQIIESVKKSIREFMEGEQVYKHCGKPREKKTLREQLEEALGSSIDEGEGFEIAVLPGAGKFKAISDNKDVKIEAHRSLSDFAALLSIILAKHVLELLGQESSQEEMNIPESLHFYVDLTHGLNYHPALTLRTIVDYARQVAIFVDEVWIHVLNSEPYPHRSLLSQKPPKLKLHIVAQQRVAANYVQYKAPSLSDFIKTLAIDPNTARSVVNLANYGRAIGDMEKSLNAMLASIGSCYPLALIHFTQQTVKHLAKILETSIESPSELLNQACKLLDKAIKTYIESVEVIIDRENATIKIKRSQSVEPSIVHSFCIALTTLCLAYASLINYIEKYRLQNALTLKDLEEIVKKLSKGRSYLLERFKIRDENSILDTLEQLDETTLYEYKEFKPLAHLFTDKKQGKLHYEHFQAHFGLERNITHIKLIQLTKIPSADNVLLKYELAKNTESELAKKLKSELSELEPKHPHTQLKNEKQV